MTGAYSCTTRLLGVGVVTGADFGGGISCLYGADFCTFGPLFFNQS